MPERLVLDLEATADCAFDPDFNYKFQGRVYQALDGTHLGGVHDSSAPGPFTFSNPRPHGDMAAGDHRELIVSSPHGRDLYDLLVANFADDPELNLGHMCFEVTDARTVEVDVGPPGSTGIMRTPTGVFQRLSHEVCERHDIDPPDRDEKLYWASDDHPPLALFEQARRNLSEKLDAYHAQRVQPPNPEDDRLFRAFELSDAGAMRKTVTSDETLTLLYSKWRLEYEVQDAAHRTWLNTLLSSGLGARSALGLGYLHIVDQTTAAEQTTTTGQQANEAVACPSCDRDDFKNEHGMRTHHVKVHGESLTAEERICPNCREPFEVSHWIDKTFCTRACANEFRSEDKRERRDCEWCGLSLQTWPSWDTEYHQECYFEAKTDRDRPEIIEELARELYEREERAIRESWRLTRGHGFDITRDEFWELLDQMGIVRTSLARKLRSAEDDVDGERA